MYGGPNNLEVRAKTHFRCVWKIQWAEICILNYVRTYL